MKKILTMLFFVLALLALGCAKTEQGQVSDVTAVRQIVAQDNTTSRTIMWQGTKKHTKPQIEYVLEGKKDVRRLDAKEDIFTDDKIENHIYTVELKDLTPGQKYTYRVGYEGKFGAWNTLTTPTATTSFKALIFPDSQSSDYTDWNKVAQKAWSLNPHAQFFINMGDLVDNGEDHNQWDAWFSAVSGMENNIPVAPVMGNHETYNLEWKVRMPVAYTHFFNLPANGTPKFQNQYYSFDYGNIHFVVLNTQMKELDEFQPDMLKTQLTWLKEDLAKTQKKWKVALLHKDVLQYGFKSRPEPRPEGISEIGEIFMPIFDEFKVDAVLTAHLHTYRRRGRIEGFKRSKTGPQYILTGVAGNVRYPDLWKDHSLDEYVAPQPETDNYMTLEATEKDLRFTCFLPNGEKLDTVLVTKP